MKGMKMICGTVIVVAAIFLLSFLDNWAASMQGKYRTESPAFDTQDVSSEAKPDREKTKKVLFETGEMIVYEDRVRMKFSYTDKQIQNAAKTIGQLKEIDGVENVFLVPVPPSILTEKSDAGAREEYEQYIKGLQQAVGEKNVADVFPMLEEREEAMFFRTDASWTPLGAYYGSCMVKEKLGAGIHELAEYEEYRYNSFKGDTYFMALEVCPDESLKETVRTIMPETIDCYIFPEGKNLEKLEKKTESGTEWRACPVFVQSRKGIGTVVGGGKWTRAIVEGNGQAGGLLMLVDDSGKLMVPYLDEDYEKVYVVNISWCEEIKEKLPGFIEKYGIRDIVWAQSAERIGNEGYSRALLGYMTEEK